MKTRTHKYDLAKIPEPQRYRILDECHNELNRMLKSGQWQGDPKEWHPARVLTWLCEHPAADLNLKYMCAKELLGYIAAPKAAQLRIEQSGGTGDTHIQIVVAPWASDGQVRQPPADVEITPIKPSIGTSRT